MSTKIGNGQVTEGCRPGLPGGRDVRWNECVIVDYGFLQSQPPALSQFQKGPIQATSVSAKSPIAHLAATGASSSLWVVASRHGIDWSQPARRCSLDHHGHSENSAR